jgi:prevent-host-death family protein
VYVVKSVGLREINQHLSRYVKAVKAGEEVMITERGKPVAIIKPVAPTTDLEAKIRRLEAEGLLIPPRLEGSPQSHPVVPLSGQGLAQTISEMRDER